MKSCNLPISITWFLWMYWSILAQKQGFITLSIKTLLEVSSLRKGARFIRYRDSFFDIALFKVLTKTNILLSAPNHRLTSYFTKLIRFASSHIKLNFPNFEVSSSLQDARTQLEEGTKKLLLNEREVHLTIGKEVLDEQGVLIAKEHHIFQFIHTTSNALYILNPTIQKTHQTIVLAESVSAVLTLLLLLSSVCWLDHYYYSS